MSQSTSNIPFAVHIDTVEAARGSQMITRILRINRSVGFRKNSPVPSQGLVVDHKIHATAAAAGAREKDLPAHIVRHLVAVS